MVLGPALVLLSPWLVLSSGPIRHQVYAEGWALQTTGECIWFSELRESAAIGWFFVLVALGVAALFVGLWLIRSARFTGFRYNHVA